MNKDWINCIDHPKYIDFAKLLAKTDIKGKGEFYIHKDLRDNNYLIALTSYGNSFAYCLANIDQNKIKLISSDGIMPPYPNPLEEKP